MNFTEEQVSIRFDLIISEAAQGLKNLLFDFENGSKFLRKKMLILIVIFPA